jgi:O-succinylbenzoic acid--CoA ligase
VAAVTTPDWLRQRADLAPDRVALIGPDDQTWSFRDLDARVDAAAELLFSQRVRPGDRIGLLAPNGLGFAVAVQALMRLGAVLVPINTRLTKAELDWQCGDAELRLLLDSANVEQLLRAPAGRKVQAEFDLDATHSIIYTSGTTGRPKGAILTYGNHWWSAVGSALNLGLQPGDRWLACMPLFHVGGLAILLRGVIYGWSVVVHDRFDPERVNDAIDRHGISIVSVVSTMLERMLAQRGGRPYPTSLRCVLLGGGPAPLPLLEAATAVGLPVMQTYGLTEAASQVATLAPEDAQRKLGSAGKPLMGTRLQLEPDGEILVDGPTVSPGYLHAPSRSGWLRTGDLGYRDEEGYLYVLDRRDDLIVSGGENVYPAEVEAALLAHAAVEGAGVRGEPDPEWGQIVAAFVQLAPGARLTDDELTAFCRQRLAGYKVPRRILFVDELPRNAAGKLMRRELRF